MGPPALLFDLDGTLVDSARGIAAALTVQSQARGGEAVGEACVRPLIGQGVEVVVRSALGVRGGDSEADVIEFRDILASLPADSATIYPGVAEALEELTALRYPMAVVTNKPEGLARQLLVQLKLARFFQAVVGGDTLSVCKPDPAPLHHAQQLLALSGAAVMIGDSDVDAAAAASAGMTFLLFNGGYGSGGCGFVPPALRFDSFDLLLRAISNNICIHS
jgi:phosphoglycolate phosphatase